MKKLMACLAAGVMAAGSGVIIDAHGAHVAYLVTAGCAVAACAVSWIGGRSVHRAEEHALEVIAAKAAVRPA